MRQIFQSQIVSSQFDFEDFPKNFLLNINSYAQMTKIRANNFEDLDFCSPNKSTKYDLTNLLTFHRSRLFSSIGGAWATPNRAEFLKMVRPILRQY